MKQVRKKRSFILAALLLGLLLPLTSCQSSPEQIPILPPEIVFPTVPAPDGVRVYPERVTILIPADQLDLILSEFPEIIVSGEPGEVVHISSDLWVQIVEYMLDVDAARQLYSEYRDIFLEDNLDSKKE